jgi:hypothetical protein
MSKTILVISDMHVGSTVAVMPDEVYIESSDKEKAQRIESNQIQKIEYKEWCDMIDHVGQVDACFNLGDTIDGPNVKSRGFELWTSNLGQQCETAVDLLSMVKTNHHFAVQGSYYHVGENGSSDFAVLNSLKHCKTDFGTDLCVKVEDVRIHLSHEIGYTRSKASKYTALQNEIVNAMLNSKRIGHINLLLRGHRHEIQDLVDHENNMRILECPAWKARDAFAAKKGLAMVPTLGYVLLKIKGSEISVDAHTFELKKKHMFREVDF